MSISIHAFRSLDGEGNFNWRFVFPFNYLKAEEKVLKINEGSDSIFSFEEGEQKLPCKVQMQVWDADLVSADDFLGEHKSYYTFPKALFNIAL